MFDQQDHMQSRKKNHSMVKVTDRSVALTNLLKATEKVNRGRLGPSKRFSLLNQEPIQSLLADDR